MSMKMNEIEFPKVSYDEWKDAAIKALKGKPFESLFTKTVENITLEPLYTKDRLIEQLGDELEKQIATIRKATKSERFVTAQAVYGDNETHWIENLEQTIARGNELIVIDSRTSFEWTESLLRTVADYISKYPFKLIVTGNEDDLLKAFNYIESSKEEVEGYIVSTQSVTLEGFTEVRTFALNTLEEHYQGANAVQELAITLAKASEEVDKSSFDQFEQKAFVQFAFDTQFFMEIAKVRAFRVLWKAFASGYGKDSSFIPVLGETSLRSFSKLDVYVNLLRSGNSALAAAISGVDAFTVHPHDILTSPTEQSIRIARNVSLVTKEESHVLNVKDPSGGSYFIETLTAELVKKAWDLFLTIEENGGFTNYLATLNEEIKAVQQEREKQVATRKASLIGTNIYANPKDELPSEENPLVKHINRLAKPFENLRKQFANVPNENFVVLTFGQLKNYKARADYVSGVLNVAGIEPVVTDGFQTVEEAVQFLRSTYAKYVVVAATDDDTKAIVPALLKDKKACVMLDAAGRYKEEADAWIAAGLNGFIYAGQNIVEKLEALAKAVKEA